MAEEDFDAADPYDPIDLASGQAKAADEKTLAEKEARDKLSRRRDAYLRLFGGAPMQGDRDIVMDDLRRFCRGDRTPWHDDDRIHALLTGRAEVYLRIVQHTSMSIDALFEVLSGDSDR